MKLVFLTLLVFVLFVFGDENVVTLTESNFDEFIKSNDRVLVEFYAPWCGHCKSLAPEYEKAATTLKNKNSQTILAKIDATEEKLLAEKYGIKGFPTLKYFTKDTENPSEYTGGRTEQTIVSWLNKRELDVLTTIDNIETYKTYLNRDSIVLTAFYPNDAQEIKIIKKVAEALRENTLALHVNNEQVAKEVGANWNSLRLSVSIGEQKSEIAYDGEVEFPNILQWINSERFPLIGEIGPENYKDYVDRNLPLVWIAINPDDNEEKNKIINYCTGAARANKGKLSFVTLDGKKFAQHVNNLGIDNIPGLVLVDHESNKYKFTDEINEENINKFFEQYNAGTLEKFLKTQPVPESNDGNVFILVGSQFHEIVGKDKDVFVEYYAPWCGHCKQLAPEYEKLGDAFADVNDVIIAKIDATENDAPEEIKGFPTLVFYPKGTTTGVKYQGDRKAGAMVDWIKSKATVDVSAVKKEL